MMRRKRHRDLMMSTPRNRRAVVDIVVVVVVVAIGLSDGVPGDGVRGRERVRVRRRRQQAVSRPRYQVGNVTQHAGYMSAKSVGKF